MLLDTIEMDQEEQPCSLKYVAYGNEDHILYVGTALLTSQSTSFAPQRGHLRTYQIIDDG